jgi:hypothetical protein
MPTFILGAVKKMTRESWNNIGLYGTWLTRELEQKINANGRNYSIKIDSFRGVWIDEILLPFDLIEWNENGFSDTIDEIVTLFRVEELAIILEK